MSHHRQLAAIMFTDIEGYSAAMGENEVKAIRLKDTHRQVLQEQHELHHGRIIQYYGDGTLSIFNSAVEAVESAIEMQLRYRKAEVPVRIGIHIGDVVFDEEQVFGDGVNLAARIEATAVPGSILLSDKVNDELNNHPGIQTRPLGSFQFKNIKRKVEVFAVNHPDLVVPPARSNKTKGADTTSANTFGTTEKSIAVLPFENLSNDPEQQYFSEGVGEEILNSLANLKDLKVVNRGSSLHHVKDTDIREIGKKLGASTILKGSVRKQGKKLRITVQLIDALEGAHLWSEKYDRNTDDIFAIQDEVALAVTERLRVTLQEEERKKLRNLQTQNTEAYELYLKGRYYINKRGAAIITGIHCFQLAIDLDPKFALAHTGYADAVLMAAFYGLLPPLQVVHKAKAAAEKAIELDPSRAEPYCSLGCYYTCFEWNWAEGEKHFLMSIELNPRYSQAHYWYGSLILSWVKGDFIGAIAHGRIACEMEPQNSHALGMLGSILHSAGRNEEALEVCRKGVELDPEAFICQVFLGLAYAELHQYEKTIRIFEQLILASNRYHFAQNVLIVAYCMAWKFKQAGVLLKELEERSAKEYIAGTLTGLSFAFLEDYDSAFRFLDKAVAERDPMLLSIKHESWVPEDLRKDPRFTQLLQTINFPENYKLTVNR